MTIQTTPFTTPFNTYPMTPDDAKLIKALLDELQTELSTCRSGRDKISEFTSNTKKAARRTKLISRIEELTPLVNELRTKFEQRPPMPMSSDDALSYLLGEMIDGLESTNHAISSYQAKAAENFDRFMGYLNRREFETLAQQEILIDILVNIHNLLAKVEGEPTFNQIIESIRTSLEHAERRALQVSHYSADVFEMIKAAASSEAYKELLSYRLPRTRYLQEYQERVWIFENATN